MGSSVANYTYTNPVTNAASCPTGYTAKIGWGTDNLDWLFHWCYKADPVVTTTTTTPTTTSTLTTTTATTTGPQIGACCPDGSAWNSLANRCIPTTCGEGKFYCAAQKQCLAG